MANPSLSPVFDENNVEILKQSLERLAALIEVSWVCADKFKELSSAGWLNYHLLMDDQARIALTELDDIVIRCSEQG